MIATIEKTDQAAIDSRAPLFQVWFDVDCGMEATPNWWWDSEPEPLKDALTHSNDLRQRGLICIVMPEGQSPRTDGRMDNPC